MFQILVVICDCVYPPKPPPSVDQRQYSKVEIVKAPPKGQKVWHTACYRSEAICIRIAVYSAGNC